MSAEYRQLNFIIPNIYGLEHPPSPDLHSQVVDTRNYFQGLKRSGEVELTDPFVSADNYVWQFVDYYPKRPTDYYDSTRGYLMVEPDDIPTAARIVDKVYQERKAAGKRGKFKWLMMKTAPILFTDDWWQRTHRDNLLGSFVDLAPSDPRLVLYEYSTEDIQEILTELAASREWGELEAHRRATFPEVIPPIRGTDIFIDSDNNSWYSLSFNQKPGHFKDQ